MYSMYDKVLCHQVAVTVMKLSFQTVKDKLTSVCRTYSPQFAQLYILPSPLLSCPVLYFVCMTIPSHLHTNYSETPCTFFVNNNGQKDVVGAADAPLKRQRLHAVLIGLNVLYEQLNV